MTFDLGSRLRLHIQHRMADLLGEYTFPNGQTVPAISVFEPNYPPAGSKVSGLEIIITPSVEQPTKLLMEGYISKHQSYVDLKQWNPEKDTLTATNRLLANLPITEVRPRTLPTDLGNIETRRLTVTYFLADKEQQDVELRSIFFSEEEG